MIEMGLISFYLGLKAKRDREKKTIKLFQPAYTEKFLENFYLNKANAVAAPMKWTAPLTTRTKGEALTSGKNRYQGIIRWLMFPIVETRPDVT